MTTVTRWVLERDDLKGPRWYSLTPAGDGQWTRDINCAMTWPTQLEAADSDALKGIKGAGEPRVFIRPWTGNRPLVDGTGGGGPAGVATFGQFSLGRDEDDTEDKPLGAAFVIRQVRGGGFTLKSHLNKAMVVMGDTYAFTNAADLLDFLHKVLLPVASSDIAAKD